MKKKIFLLLALCGLLLSASAQRNTDRLDRGLVAVPANVNGGSGSGNFISWKIFAEEYYDVTYNLYANGRLLKEGLKAGCFTHTAGTASTKYQVAPVVRGKEGQLCAEVTRWNNGYKDIVVAPVTDRAGTNITSMYALNDISLGDVTGDGIVEFIVKRNYTGSNPGLTESGNKTRFNLYECYDISGKRLWSIDLGPNLMAGPDEQWDLVAFDWDQDGKAECIMRGADNMIIHTASGRDIKIGNMNYYAPRDEYTRNGAEYLLYLNGETGEPYGWDSSKDTFTPMTYPLPRMEKGEAANLLAPTGAEYERAWGKNDTGHRSTKHYFGAPFLDGRKASIFLGRGCYTRHKMCALDVNPATHELTQRWRWDNNNGWSDPWFGNGFHNFAIADVDWDGRDEIVFGSMIIDDNGKGLCTTGLGHGDAQHCADLDPYRHGQEQFNCNEDEPACTYWSAETGKIYYRLQSTGDDGRALAGNFSNAFPGSMGRTTQSALISLTADRVIEGGPATGGTNDALYWSHLNQRIYWDGDLLDEVMDSPGSEAREAAIYKPGGGRLFTTTGCNTNNSSKNNPGALADIFGDWREELVMRAENNTRIRIWTTAIPTTFRIYTLWHDHQYRNAMVWQCVGYNQPPHKSFFLGQMEGITVAPPPLTNTGRIEIRDGGTISATQHSGQQVLVAETADTEITVQSGAAPATAIFNVPTWVQGTGSNILNATAKVNTTTYTCTVKGAAFTGDMRLVKQGDGTLTLPATEQTYTGPTDIWAGTLNFNGKLLQSDLWLNRFARLNSDGGRFKSIKMDYASLLLPGGEGKVGQLTTDTLALGFGARVKFDLNVQGDRHVADQITLRGMSIETKSWKYGPQYLAPVFEFAIPQALSTDALYGRYLIISGLQNLKGKISDIVIEGLGTALKARLEQADDGLYLIISQPRTAGDIAWSGAQSATWEFGGEENFSLIGTSGEATDFVTGDRVHFTDEATRTSVSIKGDIEADSIIVEADKSYTFGGTGAIVGKTNLVKRGKGTLTIQNDNSYTGATRISEGIVSVSSLANENQAYGNLGAVKTAASKFIIENGAELRTTATVTQGSPMQMLTEDGGVINNSADFIVNKPISGTVLTKKGTGWMKMNTASNLQRLVVQAGTVQCINANRVATTLQFEGGTYLENTGSAFEIHVPQGKTGTWNTANRSTYSNKITGEGTLTIFCEEEKGSNYFATRTQLALNLSSFEGTIKATGRSDDSGARWTLNSGSGMPKATLDIAAGLEVQNTGKAFAIGRLAGTGKLGGYASFANDGKSGANTWNIGNDEDWSWSGTLVGNSIFAKVGNGRATFTAASTHTGANRVNAGQLHMGPNATLGTGTLTVARDATLSGTTANNKSWTNSTVTIQNGGTLAVTSTPQTPSVNGLIDFGGKNVTFAAGSTLRLAANRCATPTSTGGTSLQNIASLTMNATIRITVPADHKFSAGDSILLWKDVKKLTGTPVLAHHYIAEGLYWDDSDIDKGILRVTNVIPTSVSQLAEDTRAATVYDLNGRPVATPRRGQTYIVGGRKVIMK